MTNFVTPDDALIASPADWPASASAIPEVFDAFARLVEGLTHDKLVLADGGEEYRWAHRGHPEYLFRLTPVLKDGCVSERYIPESWEGRVTRTVLESFLRARFVHYERPAGWGAHLPVVAIRKVNGLVERLIELPGKRPLVDPLRDAARTDDDTVIPVTTEFAGEWSGILTEWEHVDGFLAGPNPGGAWLGQRMRRVAMPFGRWWWELRGRRDAGDSNWYDDRWHDPTSITAYLGWPAYVLAAVGQVGRCPGCGGPTVEGRQYCGDADCDRDRASARQRNRRAAKRAMGS